MLKEYNKLVRDKIPQIIEQDGNKANFRILSEEVYLKELDKKLDEEVKEYQSDKSIGEIADILEVIEAICDARGYSKEKLDKIKMEKAKNRGAFSKRIFLESVEEGEI